MPRLVGMAVPDMWAVALRAGVRVKIHHVSAVRPVAGHIVGQVPSGGARVLRDSVVDLHVSFAVIEDDEADRPFG